MNRRTTLWEDLGIGVLAGATIVLTSAVWVLLASERGVMRMNRIGPSSFELDAANPDGIWSYRICRDHDTDNVADTPPRADLDRSVDRLPEREA